MSVEDVQVETRLRDIRTVVVVGSDYLAELQTELVSAMAELPDHYRVVDIKIAADNGRVVALILAERDGL